MAKKEKAKKPEEPEADKPAAEGEEGAPAKKKMAGKTLILFIVLPAVLVIGGGAAAAMMLLGGGAPAAASPAGEHGADASAHGEPKEEKPAAAAGGEHGGGGGEHGAEGGAAGAGAGAEAGDVGHALECAEGNPCYYAMPKLVVNLAGTEGQRSPYMELELTLESSASATFAKVPELMPRLKDQLNSFLRELRVEDLNGSTGTWRLRRELLNRFNTVMDPKKVDAVLIESMLIQ